MMIDFLLLLLMVICGYECCIYWEDGHYSTLMLVLVLVSVYFTGVHAGMEMIINTLGW